MHEHSIFKIGAIIFDEQGKMLAVHKKGKPANELIVPGGVRENNETDEQTLRREIWEELSANVTSFQFYDQFEAQAIYEDKWLIMRVYVVTLDRAPQASQEIDQLVWLGADYQQTQYQFASILGQQILPRLFHQQNNDCPFGEKLQRYWDRRYDYFQRFDEGIQLDAEGLHTVMPEEAALKLAAQLGHVETVLDGFCGVGGVAIALARTGKRVFAIELDAERLAMAEQNAVIYGVDHKITFLHGDYFAIAPTVSADAVVLDPPWGWPRYRQSEAFLLEDFAPSGKKLIEFSLSYFRSVLLRAPRHFQTSTLDQFAVPYKIHEDKLRDEIISKSILMTSQK